jgi:RNA polymerase sigma factor (sigma-70 family)
MGDTENTPTEMLVGAAQGGDRRALETLFARYLPRVRRLIALRLGHTVADFLTFEDIVQDSMLDVFRNLDKFEERSEARFCNWLAVCVANKVKEHFRRGKAKKRSPTLPFAPLSGGDLTDCILAGDATSPPLLAEGAELAERIDAVLLSMEDDQREAIILARICGMSHDEIARNLDLPTAAAARKLLSRALAVLAARLPR